MISNNFKLSALAVLAMVMSGCSLTDHSNDYRNGSETPVPLQLPEGAIVPRDDLVIPHQDTVGDVEKGSKFVVPRAVFVFYPMAQIPVDIKPDRFVFTVPANKATAKKMAKDFLLSLNTDPDEDDKPIASETEDQIISGSFQSIDEGWWASGWGGLTNSYPERTIYSFTFSNNDNDNDVSGTVSTMVSVQYRTENDDDELSAWMGPESNDDVYADIVRWWGDMGRQLHKASAYLSQRGSNTPFNLWIDHRGVFAIHLKGNESVDDLLATQLALAGLERVEGKVDTLSVKHSAMKEQNTVAPDGAASNGEITKDVSWEDREYPYKIVHQNAGDFLVIDVASSPTPEVAAFHLAQRFVQ